MSGTSTDQEETGMKIGEQGKAGTVTGPHLHFDMTAGRIVVRDARTGRPVARAAVEVER